MGTVINILFIASAVIPLTFGFAYLFRPKAVRTLQSWFRKKLANLEKGLYKRRRLVGSGLTGLGLLVVYTYFQPVWVYNVFMVARFVMTLLFPETFEQIQHVQATPMVCI